MLKRLVLLALLVALFALLGWKLERQQQQIIVLRTELDRSQSVRETALRERGVAQRALQAAIDREAHARAENGEPAGSDTQSEDVLAPWLAKIQALKDYLKKHPELSIPGMAKLTAKDWLNLTAGDDTYTHESDLRTALAQVRALVRQKTGPELQGALRQFLAANNNQPPTDPHQLAQYLPAGEDPSLLDSVQANPGGAGGSGRPGSYFLYAPPVDPWDGKNWYGVSSWSSTAGLDGDQPAIQAAIAKATQENGAPPTDPSQIANYPGISRINPDKLAVIFGALTTKL